MTPYLVEITPLQLREVATQVEAAAARITEELSTANAEIRSLSDDVFDGRAADALFSEYATSYRQFEAMPAELRGFAFQLREIADTFEELDARLAGRQGQGGSGSGTLHTEATYSSALQQSLAGNAWQNKEFNAQFVWDNVNYLGATVGWGLAHHEQLGTVMHRALSGLDSIIPGGDMVGDLLYVKGAGLSPDLFYNHTYVLKGVRTLGIGVTDGLIDYAVGGAYSFDELATQVASGVLQTVVLGPNVQFIDAGVQVFGNLTSNLIEDNADWLAMGDVTRASEIVSSANEFQSALEVVSLDNIADNTVSAVFSGDFEQLSTDFTGYLEGGSTVISEGYDLVKYSVEGVADQIAANTYIDESINDIATGIGNAAEDFWNSLNL